MEEKKKNQDQFEYNQINLTMGFIIISLLALLLLAVWIG